MTTDLAAEQGGIRDGRRAEDADAHAGNGRADSDGSDARNTASLNGDGAVARGGATSDGGRASEDCAGAGSAVEKRAAVASRGFSREDNATVLDGAEAAHDPRVGHSAVVHDPPAVEGLAHGENAVIHDSASANSTEPGGAAAGRVDSASRNDGATLNGEAVEDRLTAGRGEALREAGSRVAAGRAPVVMHDPAANGRVVSDGAEVGYHSTSSDAAVMHDSASAGNAEVGAAAVMHDSASANSTDVSRAAAVIHETPEQGSATGGREASTAPAHIEPSARPKPRGRWWRGFTGSVAAGMAVLAVGVLVVGVLCLVNGASGPGVLKLVGHPVAAVIVLALQRIADRRVGKVAALAGAGVLVVAGVAFGVLWWF
ncbi:hypothetical protein [Amycolatopsis sp. cg13]|uniref:hypothetical protein n=1 Tax=Amycolatopsis sp. cg13 TaxID=3238807 RepID=UPI00352470DC